MKIFYLATNYSKNVHRSLVGKLGRKRLPRGPTWYLENNIKTKLKERVSHGVYCIQMATHSVYWLAVGHIAMTI